MNKNDIYMIQGTDYKQMTLELLEKCRLAEDIGDRGRRIGLKPNLVLAKPASSGAVTHSELVDGVLTYLKGAGFYNIVVLESSWVGDRTSQAVKASGILEVCHRHQVEFLDLQKDSSIACTAENMDIAVCRKALEIEYLINMPVVKGHCQTLVTCALKNSKGLIPGTEKRRFHTMGLHEPIARLNTIIRQNFILADNICGDLDFEEGGNPVVMDRILAFKDPVLCDSFAAETLGYHPEDIAYIRLAEQMGVGSTDLSKANIHQLREGYKKKGQADRKSKGRVGQLAGYAAPKDACSACYGSLIYALDRLDREKGLTGRKGKIAVGQGYQGQKGEIGVGRCTGCFEKNLPGCPPKAVDILKFLKDEWKDERGTQWKRK
ncbi:MAG: DUF362 domain-containing protein [Ruminococcus sp.]|jgi:uncharacterized protein (DUF362 family)